MKTEAKRENYFDQLVTTYFDQLWANPFYLKGMGDLLKNSFTLRQQWNKQVEQLLSLWQLPNQDMQQRTLHTLNTLLSEWRFEQEEMNERLSALEGQLAELLAQKKAQEAKDVRKSGNAKAQ
jgi:uncharacterized coiled-coil protein SlyX